MSLPRLWMGAALEEPATVAELVSPPNIGRGKRRDSLIDVGRVPGEVEQIGVLPFVPVGNE